MFNLEYTEIIVYVLLNQLVKAAAVFILLYRVWVLQEIWSGCLSYNHNRDNYNKISSYFIGRWFIFVFSLPWSSLSVELEFKWSLSLTWSSLN